MKRRFFRPKIHSASTMPKLDIAPERERPPCCDLCWVEWEPETPFIRKGHPSNYGYYHEGCWAAHQRGSSE